jgi:hypothetical protein
MRRIPAVTPLVIVVAALAACSKSPAKPSEPGGSGSLLGQTVNAVDGSAAAGVSVQIGARHPVTSDADGHFEVEVGNPGTFQTTIRGSAIVERQTTIFGPTADRARVSLIPAGFDLAAFDEMFRTSNGRLTRWTSRPSLVVLASVMSYRNGGGSEFEATSEQLTSEEVAQMQAHLTEGLGLLTGNTFTAFQSVSVERPSAGSRVSVTRQGQIVVGRYDGIVTFVNTIGYGQWSELSSGTVVGGTMFLDRDFDRDDRRRRLLRIHELGHALGYMHVESRTSIMNPSIGPEPTDFDRAAALIAFQRPPGNRAPDTDPSSATGPIGATTGASRLVRVVCR